MVRAGRGRPRDGLEDQAGRVGPLRRHRRVPRPRGPARDQDGPGLEAGRGRPAARPQGHGLHRRPAPRAAGPAADQPAAAPRHLLDRGPGPADRRPAGDQPVGADRGQARRDARRRDDRRGRDQGRRGLHPPLRPRRRDRGVAAVVDQARGRAVGARPVRGPPIAAAQRPPRPRRAAHRRRPADRQRPADRRAARRRGVRVRHRRAGRRRLRHGAPMPPRHVPDGHRDPARGPAGQVHRHARDGGRVLPPAGRGPPPLAGGGRGAVRRRGRGRGPALPARGAREHDRPDRAAVPGMVRLGRAPGDPVGRVARTSGARPRRRWRAGWWPRSTARRAGCPPRACG